MNTYSGLVVLSGRSNPKFAGAVCEHLGIEVGRTDIVQFSDGELMVEIGENVRGRDVFVVQSTSAPANDHLMELLIMIDALKRASAGRITAVMPYFGYARQDRKLKPRVPITAKLAADLLTTAGANRVLTMDLHAGQIMGFFNIPVDNLHAGPVLVPHLLEHYGKEALTIVSPDVGGVERARLFAKKLENAPIAIIDKRRPGPNQIAEMHVVGEVAGQTCIIVDDMVDTGGTLVKACETLLTEGAAKVIAAAVHPVFSGAALERIAGAKFQSVVVTDTIAKSLSLPTPTSVTYLSVAALFAEAIRRIHGEDSISSLFQA